MKNYKYILFDLDGTLTKPDLGITNSLKYAIKKLGGEPKTREELLTFIGPPLIDSFKILGFDDEKGLEGVRYYREYFAEKGIFENELYSGIPQLLNALKNEGKVLLLATSKPIFFAEKVLVHFGLDKYFTHCAGSELDGKNSEKHEVIALAKACVNDFDSSKAVMVGDREYDILGARMHGIDSIGVLYGYGSYEELSLANADYIAKNVDEVAEILLS